MLKNKHQKAHHQDNIESKSNGSRPRALLKYGLFSAAAVGASVLAVKGTADLTHSVFGEGPINYFHSFLGGMAGGILVALPVGCCIPDPGPFIFLGMMLGLTNAVIANNPEIAMLFAASVSAVVASAAIDEFGKEANNDQILKPKR